MNWFEKEYKERFENESTSEGIESDALWSQISEAIPQKDTTRRFSPWYWLIFGLIIMGAALFLMGPTDVKGIENNETLTSENINTTLADESYEAVQKEEKTNENNTQQVASNIISETQTQNSKATISTTAISTRESTYTNTNTEAVTTFNYKKSLSKGEVSSTPTINNEPINSDRNTQVNTTSISENSSNEQVLKTDEQDVSMTENDSADPTLNSENIPSTIGQAAENLLLTDDEEESQSIVRSRLFDDIEILSGIHQFVQFETEVPDIPEPIVPVKKVNPMLPLSVQLHSNITFMNLRYGDHSDPELFAAAANESIAPMQIANGFGINLEYQLNRNFSILSGVELNNYEHKLFTVLTKDTTALDGNQVLRKAIEVRTVHHHNKLSVYTIPLELSYQTSNLNAWSLGSSIGFAYSIVHSQRGKALGRNNTILEYTDDDNAQFGNFLSFRLNPFVQYNLTDKASIRLNIGVSYQSHGIAAPQNLKQRSLMYRLGLGLKYNL